MKNDRFAAAIPDIERVIGYTFRDKGLLRQAFTRSSWRNEHPKDGYQSNEVLEFFGDSVLSVAIISFLLSDSTERCEYGIRTELGEGDFSNIKSKLSDKTNLAVSMAKLGLAKHLLLGEGDAKLGISGEPSVMEDLFESIVGAVYIDSDKSLDMVTKVVTKMLDMSVYSDSSVASVSPKNALQEWCADKKRRLPPPVYRTISETGPDHKKEYERGVYIGERLLASARGKNQKTADTLAAKEALRMLVAEERAKEKTPEPPASMARAEQAAPRANLAKPAKPDSKGKKPDAKQSEGKKKPAATPKAPKEKADKATEHQKPKAPAEHERQKAKSEKLSPEATGEARTKSPVLAKPKRSALSASALLRAHAAKMSVAGPVFRDLGMIAEDEHSVECSFMGQRAIATAPTRPEAKERAAATIRDALKIK